MKRNIFPAVFWRGCSNVSKALVCLQVRCRAERGQGESHCPAGGKHQLAAPLRAHTSEGPQMLPSHELHRTWNSSGEQGSAAAPGARRVQRMRTGESEHVHGADEARHVQKHLLVTSDPAKVTGKAAGRAGEQPPSPLPCPRVALPPWERKRDGEALLIPNTWTLQAHTKNKTP